jgi:hypothetical protein
MKSIAQLLLNASLALLASAEPNPLAAIDVEKVASQVAATEGFRNEARPVFATLTGSSQAAARRLIDAMAGPERVKASGSPLDAIVARQLTAALVPLIQDADAKSVILTHGHEGRLDLLLAAFSSNTKPAISATPANRKATAAEKNFIEKAIVDKFLGPKGSSKTHYFAKDGSLYRFTEDFSQATVLRWTMLKDGTIFIQRFGFKDFMRVAPDKTVLHVGLCSKTLCPGRLTRRPRCPRSSPSAINS